jgi:hypothetical protein
MKAVPSIVITLSGILIVFKLKQFLKQFSGISSIPSGISISSNLKHSSKQPFSIFFIEEGIINTFNVFHPEKISLFKIFSFEFTIKVSIPNNLYHL